MTIVETGPAMRLRPPDLQNLEGKDTGRAHLSHSSIGVQLSCLKKYEWAYVDGLERIDRPEALTLGSAFHHGIEHGDPQAAADMLADRPYSNQSEHDKLLIDMATVYAAVNGYLLRYGTKDESIEREYGYRVRLRSPYTGRPSLTYDLKGIADGVTDCGSYLEITEDKFVGQITDVTVQRVRLDRQVSLAAYALWRITGKPTKKVRYRHTRKPTIRQRKDESVGEFVERLRQDYLDRPDFYYVETETFRDEGDLLLIEAELWQYAEMLRHAAAGDVYPRNVASCDMYGRCAFLDLCLHGQEAMSLYRKKEDR